MKIKVSLKENDNRLRSGMVFGKWTQFPTPEAYNALYDDDERGIYQIFLKFQSRVDGIEKNRQNPGYVIKSILPSLINIFKILQETIKNKTGFGYEPTVEFKNMPNIIGKLSSMPFEGPSWQIKDSWDLYYKMEDIVKNELIQVQQFLKEDVIPMLLGESKKIKTKNKVNLTESTQKKLLQLCNLSEYQDEVLRENALENDKDLALNESVQRTSPEKMLSIIQKSIEQMIPIIIDWRTEQDIPQGLSFDRRFLSCENVFPQSLEENDKGYILHVYDGKTKQEVSFQIDWDAITYMAINWEYGER
jgi:hypothetical protein